MIYAFQMNNLLGHIAPVKIGYSDTCVGVKKRLSDAQVWCPYKLKIILATEGDRKLEKAIHAILRRFQMLGEWFGGTESFCLPLWLKQLEVESFRKLICHPQFNSWAWDNGSPANAVFFSKDVLSKPPTWFPEDPGLDGSGRPCTYPINVDAQEDAKRWKDGKVVHKFVGGKVRGGEGEVAHEISGSNGNDFAVYGGGGHVPVGGISDILGVAAGDGFAGMEFRFEGHTRKHHTYHVGRGLQKKWFYRNIDDKARKVLWKLERKEQAEKKVVG